MSRVAIFGASGFVGSTLVERLWQDDQIEVCPFIHSTGNAWRLGRWGRPLKSVDILSGSDVDDALKGCTHVVNCTRGPADVMSRGLHHLLSACRRRNIKRFVHLSSVAVYAGPFPDKPISESFSQIATESGYGLTKYEQDVMVEEACRNGLPSCVLCPPNITGAGSPFLLDLMALVRADGVILLDDGSRACPTIDVENLVHAIRRALDCDQADGKRIFVTDSDECTWNEMISWLQHLTSTTTHERVTSEQASCLLQPPRRKRASLTGMLRHLASSNVREVLTEDPLIAAMELAAKRVVGGLPGRWQERMKASTNGQSRVSRKRKLSPAAGRYLSQQLRGARYSTARASEVLDYSPPVDIAASRSAFERWYRCHFAVDSEAGQLLQLLG